LNIHIMQVGDRYRELNDGLNMEYITKSADYRKNIV